MLNLKTIQSRLFITYSLIFSIIIIIFILYYFSYNSEVIKNQEIRSMESISDYILSQTETDLKNMNSTSIKIISSDMMKNIFFNDTTDSASSLFAQRDMQSIIFSIAGSESSIYQINIFDIHGKYNSFNFSTIIDQNPKSIEKINSIPWLENTIRNSGVKYITTPHLDNISNTNITVISLCRAFSEVYGMNTESIVEIQQDYNIFRGFVEKAVSQSNSIDSKQLKVYIINDEGQLIYPNHANDIAAADYGKNYVEVSKSYWNKIKKNNNDSGTLILDNQQSKDTDTLAYTHSDFLGWTVFTAESEKSLLKPLYTFRNNTLLAGLAILFLTFIVSFFVARKLTRPIKKIHKSIRQLTLDTLHPHKMYGIKSNINELEELNLAFKQMRERLTKSLDEVVSSRTHEIQSHILALQAQMNPHFLYNTLSLISVMAEESQNTNIVKVAEDLSKMLRYISSDSIAPVNIEQEFQFVSSYVDLLKARYGHKLVCELNIPESMYEIKIPKLSIQPIVENCIKYGTNVRPPWFIKVQGKLLEETWQITIQDSGPGFGQEQLSQLKKRLESANHSTTLHELKLNGMGLINIYIRLKHLYGEQAVFELSDNPDGGAVVIIGGTVT